MMKHLGLTAALVAASASLASAQSITLRFGPQPQPPVWTRDAHPYAASRHRVCMQKAWRLREYERFAASDGRIGRREQREIQALRWDLDRTCGRFRWRG